MLWLAQNQQRWEKEHVSRDKAEFREIIDIFRHSDAMTLSLNMLSYNVYPATRVHPANYRPNSGICY